jgi:5'-3' exonuclease
VICSVDKDLLQVPGHHYNFVKDEYRIVNDVQGNLSFYSQLLTGDDSDGIIGLRGVGPKTALKLLKGLQTPFAMWATVLKEWLQRTPRMDGEPDEEFYSRVLNMLHMNAKLLYLLRSPDDFWVEPVYEG